MNKQAISCGLLLMSCALPVAAHTTKKVKKATPKRPNIVFILADEDAHIVGIRLIEHTFLTFRARRGVDAHLLERGATRLRHGVAIHLQK